MVTMTKLYETEIVTKINRTIEIEQIDDTDFASYIDTKHINVNGNEDIVVDTGITSIDNLKLVRDLEDINDTVSASKMYNKTAEIMKINKENFEKILNGELHTSGVVETTHNSLPTNDDVLVLYNWGSNKIANLHYNFISIPIKMGYMDGSTDNQNYDLEKLLEKLKQDENVIDRENLCITSIPYYNATPTCNKSIEFYYLLPTDIYNKVVSMNYWEMRCYILRECIGVEECKKYMED